MSSANVAFAVLNQAWQVAAVALIVAALVRLLGHRRPQLALLLWTLVFVKCLIPPVWSSPVGLFSWMQLRVEAAERVLPPDQDAATFGALPAVAQEPASTTVAAADFHLADRPWAAGASCLVAIWLTGAFGTALLVVLGWRRCRRQIRESQIECDPLLRRQVNELGLRLGLRRKVELVVCQAAFGPAAAGIFRPQLILPHRLIVGRSFEQLEAIIAHELIHLRRHDPMLLLIELTAKVLWWFHPLVWYAGRQTARLRERCCDAETVAGLECQPTLYARSLLDVLEHLQVCRGLSMAPGVRPAEVTLERLETIMRESHTFRKQTPRYVWLLLVLAAALLLPGSPLVLRSQGGPQDSLDPAAVEQKLAELERASRQAGLTAEETKAVVGLAKRVRADKYELFKLQANGKLSDAENRAFEKLVRELGHPLEKELVKLREVAANADLTAEETAAAERVALQEGFNNEAIIIRYESGKLSPVEKAAFEKVISLQGHPRAKEIENLTAVARQAGLSDQQIQTLRGLAARAEWNLETIKELSRSNQLSEAESAAVAKLAPEIARMKSQEDEGDSEKARKFRQLAGIAGLSDAETKALLDAIKQAGDDENGLLTAKQTGKLSAPAATGLKKLEVVLGKLEDFVASPHKKEIGKLLEAASGAGLSPEESGLLVKLAVRVQFDLDNAKELKASGKLTEAESRIFDKLRTIVGR